MGIYWKDGTAHLSTLHDCKSPIKTHHILMMHKKLSCHRQTVRCFMSLNILISHSRHSKWHCSVRECKCLLVFHWNYVCTVRRTIYEIFSIKKWHDLETRGRGCSRSLKMAPFDRSYMTFYWSAIVSIAVCCTIFKLCNVEESWPSWPWKCHWRSFRLVPFERLWFPIRLP